MNSLKATLPTSGGFTMTASRLIPAMAAAILLVSMPIAAAVKKADATKADAK